jgi:hypothetical protein
MGTYKTTWSTYKTHNQRSDGRKLQVLAREMCKEAQPDFRKTRNHELPKFVVLSLIAMNVTGAKGNPLYTNQVHFSRDEGPIGVDNGASGCISNQFDDFDGPSTDVKRSLKGLGGDNSTTSRWE